MSSELGSREKYMIAIVVAGGLILLGPYLGIHIFSSTPTRVEQHYQQTNPEGRSRPVLKNPSRRAPQPTKRKPRKNKDSFSDLEQLLSKN